jgi:hypothetical protein
MVADHYSIRGTLTMFDGLKFDSEAPEIRALLELVSKEPDQALTLGVGVRVPAPRSPSRTASGAGFAQGSAASAVTASCSYSAPSRIASAL